MRVATVVAMRTAYRSLSASQASYYAAYRFADVFAQIKRAPRSLESRITAIPGVASVTTRVVVEVTLDVPELDEPATGRLRVLNRQPTQGRNGVRLGIEATGRYLVCANYSSGTVAVLPIEPDGALGPLRDLVPLTGKTGPHPTEQTGAHPHDVAFDPRMCCSRV